MLATVGVALMVSAPRGPREGLAVGGAWPELGDLLRLRRDRLSLRGDVGVETPSRPLAAPFVLVAGLAMQASVAGGLSRAVRPRRARGQFFRLWRSSLFAGFMGALASQFWFIAFALTDAARVRTLALVEVPLAQAVSLKLFREPRPCGTGSASR